MVVVAHSDEDEAGLQLDELNSNDSQVEQHPHGTGLTAKEAWCIYVSHFLSMWNSRIYEYAGVLFAHSAFPGTLLPTSLIGISETICIIASSAALGHWIDSSQSRLHPLVTSIVINRISLGSCCLMWLVVSQMEAFPAKQLLFAAILVLGMAEKTTRTSNMISMERDWIPVLAGNALGPEGGGIGYSLTHLNTILRRIDITCKFLTPLVANALMAVIPAAAVTVPLFLAGFSGVSVGVEIAALNMVWNSNQRIRRPKHALDDDEHSTSGRSTLATLYQATAQMIPTQVAGIRFYFSTSVWIPSFGIALMHASVLDWAGTLVTWLLNAGYTYTDVTIAKGVGTVFEIGSTFVFPMAVAFFASRAPTGADRGAYQTVSRSEQQAELDQVDDEDKNEAKDEQLSNHPADRQDSLEPIIRTGRYGIYALLAMLIPATIALFGLDDALGSSRSAARAEGSADRSAASFSKAPVSTTVFFAFLSSSFLGRWVYDLSVTQLTQVHVDEAHRSEFGGAEQALFAVFQFAHWTASAIWSDEDDFKWLGLASLIAVAGATVGFVYWNRTWKGN